MTSAAIAIVIFPTGSPSLIEIGGLDEISAYVIMPEGLMAPQPIHGISGVAELSYGTTFRTLMLLKVYIWYISMGILMNTVHL